MEENRDEYFMRQALFEAKEAYDRDEIPVGVVIVYKDRIIARGHNLTETLNDVTAHAEMQAITSAAGVLGGKYLIGCTVYVTLEPCIMCAGALGWSQILGLFTEQPMISADFKNLPRRLCILRPRFREVFCKKIARD